MENCALYYGRSNKIKTPLLQLSLRDFFPEAINILLIHNYNLATMIRSNVALTKIANFYSATFSTYKAEINTFLFCNQYQE